MDYIAEHRNPDNVNVERLIRTLSLYMITPGKQSGPVGWEAVHALGGGDPFVLEKSETELLTNAVKERTLREVEAQFDAHNQMGTTFQQLPAEAQTVLLDFSYQYGTADEIHKHSKNGRADAGTMRREMWTAYYQGDWQTIARRLRTGDIPDQRRGAAFMERRKEEGQMLQKALERGGLPAKGNPCAPRPGAPTPGHQQAILIRRNGSMWS
ncbi:pesticin C-terminus-like muramidase [Acidithiobacillus sp.]